VHRSLRGRACPVHKTYTLQLFSNPQPQTTTYNLQPTPQANHHCNDMGKCANCNTSMAKEHKVFNPPSLVA
jgi:hypothetical protein